MSRDVPFNPTDLCDICGKPGAWDFMGDLICQACVDIDIDAGQSTDVEFNRPKQKIQFVVRSGSDHCECCGGYEWEHIEVFQGGELVLDHRGDNHLSGNHWGYDWEMIVKELLPSLGFEVEIDDVTPIVS